MRVVVESTVVVFIQEREIMLRVTDSDSEGKITPKSVLRHRPIGERQEMAPIMRRSSRSRKHADGSHPMGGQPSQGRKAASPSVLHDRQHWLVSVGLTVAGTVVLIWVLQMALVWAMTASNDLRYGRPRTYQVDAVVGHHDSASHPTHLIALNLGGHIEIMELPGGDASHARVLIGPIVSGDGADLVPVMLQLVDRHGNHHPDLLVHCGAMELWLHNQ